MKILHLDHVNVRGGAELALFRLLVAPSEWDATVLIPNEKPKNGDVFTAGHPGQGVTVVRRGPRQPFGASSARKVIASIDLAARLIGQVVCVRTSREIRDTDLVHANSTRAAVYGGMALWGRKTPYVVHLRDTVDTDALGGMGYRLFTRVALRRADGVIANSVASLETARPFIAERAICRVIPSASGLVLANKAQAGSDENGVRIGMVARIAPWKGQELLIRSFAQADLPPGSSLHFYGGVPFGGESDLLALQELVRSLTIEDRVHFHGHVDDVNAAIDTLDICVQSSMRPEPLGQNVLQYLARGKATIVADEGGPIEWVKDGVNGRHFRARSVEDLAEKLRDLAIDAKQRATLGESAIRTDGLLEDDAVRAAHRDFFAEVLQRKSGTQQ